MSGSQRGSRPGAGRPGSGKRPPRAGGATANGSLYERYKDALRRGHVAALRGRNEAAIDAYGEAATIAPDRALPHASIGGILVKMDRLDDAAAAFDRALGLVPRDEAALRGLADLQLRTGHRSEAAATLDRLADSLDALGRLADATDAARRALELAESRARRRQVEGFASRLRTDSSGDEVAQRALDQALRVLEPTNRAGAASADSERADGGPADVVGGPADAVGGPVESEPPAEPAIEAVPDADAAAGPTGAAAEPEPSEPVPAEPGPAAREPEPEPEPTHEPAGLGMALGAAAERALYDGDPAAHDGLLAAARAHRRAGRLSAALDACYLAIGLAPADPDLHLLLAELYLDRGWHGLATEKLLLLGRLADLDDDGAVRGRLRELIGARLADEPRLAELIA